MAYTEKRAGKLTGRWIGQVRRGGGSKSFRQAFETKREAQDYVLWVICL
jgi:hypothetical protein